MHKKQRHRTLDRTPLVHEVHTQRPMRVDLYRPTKHRQRRVERSLLRAPVEARLPAREQARDVRERRAVRPPGVVELVRERRQRELALEAGELVVKNGDGERVCAGRGEGERGHGGGGWW